jgi:acyl-CoA synthetase (AMP-forming)/AMP-acid ligase II
VFLARPGLWLRAISRHRGTVSPAPNFAYGLCLKRIRDEELAGCDLSSWQLALNGAEPVSAGVLRRFGERFAKFGLDPRALTPVYGLSEASLAVTFTPRGRGARFTALEAGPLHTRREAIPADGNSAGESSVVEVASVGVPLPGLAVQICRSLSEPQPLGEGVVGRVLVRGPSIMSGYFGQPEATARALQGGWLDTGDLGFILGGELHLCGRAKDLVILRGQNHAPQEFEDALEGLPGVRTGCAAAVGFVPPGGGAEAEDGEQLLLLVEREGEQPSETASADAAPPLEEQIRARVLERTAVRAHTVLLLAPGTLPRTSSGKLRRGEALRQLHAGELHAPDRVTVLSVAKEAARSMAALAGHRIRTALGGGEPRE